MKKLSVAAAVSVALSSIFAAPVAAQEIQVAIPYGDLNLATASGVETLNGRIEPVNWMELPHAAGAMAIVLGIGFAFDRWMMPDPPVAVVQARVDACNSRWALMWLLGFGGTVAIVFTGRPQTFFQVFAVLKVTWEAWGVLTRTFGWKAVQDRAEADVG